MGNHKWALSALLMVAVAANANEAGGEIQGGMTPLPEHAAPRGETILPAYTLQQLEQLQAETVLLEAQAAKAKAQAALAETPGKAGGGTGQVMGSVAGAAPAGLPGLAYVQEIYGSGARLKARILLPTGRAVELLPGDPLPGSELRVTAITPRSVRVADADGAGEHALPFN
ncbi:type IV pilus biogenesis protein PilP [Pseudomonas aeruginosa]|uniref:type IV pilus biogenesis protein PilP n=1 Tax=Pseudomonas aeruginosa TaxID=287 RepID=UPI00053DE651|nr:type IV pilus biogenesis protein PilP [Pseudomonas aeruginosa]